MSSPAAAPAAPADPRRYARQRFWLNLSAGLADLALLALLLVTPASRAIAAWTHALSPAPALSVLLYVVALGAGFRVLALPFDLAGRSIEIRFGMNRQTLPGWCLDELKSTLVAGVVSLLAAEVVYWLLRAAPAAWWAWAAAAFVVFLAFMAIAGPVLLLPIFFKLRPLSAEIETERILLERLHATTDRLRRDQPRLPRLHGIFEWKLGEKTAKANAALTGLGRTRRVIISDTLLADSPPEEIEAVFVHELGHHAHGDIWRGLAFQSALIFLGFWVSQWALAALSRPLHLAGIADVAGLPLLVLVFSLLGLALLPVSNAFVRAMERRADDYAFANLGGPEPLIAALERLAARNLAEVSPPRWKEWLLYSHPSISTRIRRGRVWQARAASASL
ncbi:MAG: M48 family metalloprotease [Terriglobales bacterium]